MDVGRRVESFDPKQNKITLDNGREYTYKALVVNTGFDHSAKHIEGLKEQENDRGENKIFVHEIDDRVRLVERNYYHGWHHSNGDMICYAPEFPYKGEGSDFYAFYYEHIMRYDKMQDRAAKNAKI